MNLIIKNYVNSETKTFKYSIKNVDKLRLSQLLHLLLKGNLMFDFRVNQKSNTLSFQVLNIYEFERFKILIKRYLN